MLKKTITYEDLEGNKVTDDFYFHLSINDLLSWGEAGGETFLFQLEMAGKTDHAPTILAIFRKILEKSVGIRSEDGRSFNNKDQAAKDRFLNSDAYSTLVLDMIQNADSAAEFVNAVIPKNVQQRLKEIAAAEQLPAEASPPKKLEDYTLNELTAMPVAQMQELVRAAHVGTIPKDVLVLAFQRGITIR